MSFIIKTRKYSANGLKKHSVCCKDFIVSVKNFQNYAENYFNSCQI